MRKTDLIEKMMAKSGLDKKQAAAALDAFTASVTEALAEGDNVQLIGFGTFEVKVRKARQGKNPRTNEVIEIPETKVPAFKAGAAFKKSI